MLENTEKNENEAGVGPFLKKDNENVIKAPVFGIDQTGILILHPLNSLSNSLSHHQCDKIGQFFALWAAVQSWCQQLFYPNCPHF